MTNETSLPHFQLLNKITGFIDRLIDEHGDILFMVFAVLCLFAIAWILTGGLRRRSNRILFIAESRGTATTPPTSFHTTQTSPSPPRLPASSTCQGTTPPITSNPDDSDPQAFSA